MSKHAHAAGDRHGARQKERFDPQRAARLDDPARFEYLPVEEVERLLAVPRGGRLVDFGTGTGTYAIELARRRPEIEVLAVDELPEMLAHLRAKLRRAPLPNLHAVLAGEVPEDERADRLLALNVLHELGDEALRSLGALLKPQGAGVFVDWNAEAERPVGPPADHLYSPAEARERLERFGFKIERHQFFPYHYAFRARRR
jgi:SAM-dependent methyltransferase